MTNKKETTIETEIVNETTINSESSNIGEAMLKVMNKVKYIQKTMKVGSGQNSYKGLSDFDVRDKVRQVMMENDLIIFPIEITPTYDVHRYDVHDTQKGLVTKQSVFCTVTVKCRILHTKSGEHIDVMSYGHGADTQDKASGKAITYAIKYAILNAFLIPTGVDTDNTHSDDMEVAQSHEAMKAQYITSYEDTLNKAKTMEELKDVFTEYYTPIRADKELVKIVISMKDTRKSEIEAEIKAKIEAENEKENEKESK